MDQNEKISTQLSIGVLFPDDFGNKGSWHLTSYYIYEAIRKHFPKTEIITVQKPKLSSLWFINSILSRVFNRTYNFSHTIVSAIIYNRRIQKQINGKSFDYIVVPAMSTSLCRLKTSSSIIYISDTTFNLFYNYYEWFSNFIRLSVIEGNYIERKAIQNSTISIFSSDWAVKDAIDFYNSDPSKVFKIPFGANLKQTPNKSEVLNKQSSDICKLLFIGKEWDRKGGQKAVDTVFELEKIGIQSQLTIIGCEPNIKNQHPRIHVYPFLDRSKEKDENTYETILKDHHFLILPTNAECFGIVFCEANAYGLPAITSNTGGIPSVIIDGVNGYKLPLTATAEKYAQTIHSVFSRFKERYLPLVKSSRNHFDTRLNWDAWSKDFISIISQENSKR